MLGHDSPDEAAPDGGHVHEVVTLGNRRTGDMVRWEQCATCPAAQPATTWTDPAGNRHLLTDGAHLTIPTGLSLDQWWAEHEWDPDETDTTTTFIAADFAEPRRLDVPYGLDWAERDEWLHHLAGEAWDPEMTDDEYLDMLNPLEPDDSDDGEHP